MTQGTQNRERDTPEHETREKRNGPAIEFRSVVKGFSGRRVLDDISFQVAPGEVLCVLGRSGGGKSVTLKLMIGLMRADSGQVMVEGRNLAELNQSELADVRRGMGYMFQSAALFDSFTLSENLALPLHRLDESKSLEQIRKCVDQQLRAVGLEKDGAKMPAALSGGMQKRAGLARALVLEPKILLVDEPSSGLDSITASEIDDLLLQRKREQHTTMVIVTHDVRGARKIADKLAVLDKGKLIAFGSPEELDEQQDPDVKQFIAER